MTRSRKRLIMFMAMVLMAALIFSGCQTSKPSSDGNTSDPTKAPTAKPTEKAPEEGTKDPETIIWYSGGDDQTKPQPVFDKLNEILLERHNILLDFRTYPFGTYDEKMNMIISSGEDYELCFTSKSWVNRYPIQVSKGAFLALDDYLPN